MLNSAHSLRKALLVKALLVFCIFNQPAFANDQSSIDYWRDLYPDNIHFDVIRNGNRVGNYTARFNQIDNQLLIESTLQIKLKILGILPYQYTYQSLETWTDNTLNSINITITENTDNRTISANRTNASTFIVKDSEKGKSIIDDFSFASNHYNANVIYTTRIFNTLTGAINNVTISLDSSPLLTINGNAIRTKKYTYSGDLKDTNVWYDEQGRWVKLSFISNDNSTFEFLNPGNNHDS